MARNTERSTRRSAKDAARRTKKKPCALCRDKIEWVDYKDVNLLRKYMSDRGKIRARRVSGNCAQHQREIALAIKTARELVLLPYTQRTMTERSGGRRSGRGDRFGGGRPPRAEADQAGSQRPDRDADARVESESDGGAPPVEAVSGNGATGEDGGGAVDQAEAGSSSEADDTEAVPTEGRR